MNLRENTMAILNGEPYDYFPIVHFGFWGETLQKWVEEGHLAPTDIEGWGDGNEVDDRLCQKLGFDFDWFRCVFQKSGMSSLYPMFRRKILERRPNGILLVTDSEGALVLEKKNTVSIPTEVGHTLTDRQSWERDYLPRLQFSEKRINKTYLRRLAKESAKRDKPLGLFVGSMMGQIRNWLGVEGLSYLCADDYELLEEIVNTVGNLTYQVTELMLSFGVAYDFAHYWEDMCCKSGPLIIPRIFDELAGPHYKRLSRLITDHGIKIISADCDGMIDALLPTWVENGVNTMFPIEVGTWGAEITPWREKYGKNLRGVGGMNKNVFSATFVEVEQEIQRLKSLIALGGYLPCPDHRIAPDAKFENVLYYCKRLREITQEQPHSFAL